MKQKSSVFAVVVTVASLLASMPATAQRKGVAKGAGLEVCEMVLANMKGDHVDAIYTEWIIGYISGYNLFGQQAQLEQIPDGPAMDAYLQKYCRENPLDKVIWASMSLINDLGGYRPPYLKK